MRMPTRLLSLVGFLFAPILTHGAGFSQPPVIASFSAYPTTIMNGGSSTLSWSVSGATNLFISSGVGDVMSGNDVVVTPATTTTYTLTAINGEGWTTQTVTVIVLSPNPDLAPPLLESLELSPELVEVSDEGATVVATVRITDDASGFDYGWITIASPTGQSRYEYFYVYFFDWQRTSGDGNDGVYEVEFFIPQYSIPGEWRVSHLDIIDRFGRYWSRSGSDLEDYLESIDAASTVEVNFEPDSDYDGDGLAA